MQLDQIRDQREADAGALVGAAPGALDAMKALEDARQLVLGNARARVAHRQLDPSVSDRAQADPDAALEGELEGIRQQIEQDALPHLRIDEGAFDDGFAFDREHQPCAFDRGAKGAREIGREPRQVDLAIGRADAACLDASEVEQRVDQAQEPQLIVVDRGQLLTGERAARGQRILRGCQHQRERRAKLVAHVAEEGRLGPVELGERRGAPALLLVQAGVRERRRHLVRQQGGEVAIAARRTAETGSTRR